MNRKDLLKRKGQIKIKIKTNDKLTYILYNDNFNPKNSNFYLRYGPYDHVNFFKQFYGFLTEFYKNKNNERDFISDLNKTDIALYNKDDISMSIFKKHINIIVTSEHVLVYTQSIVDKIKELFKKKRSRAFVALKIFGNPIGHMNMLTFYNDHRQMLRYEPMGIYGGFLGTGTDEILSLFLSKEFPEFKYSNREMICGLSGKGPQMYENMGNFDTKKDYCIIFSYLYVIYSLDYPEVDPVNMVRLMDKGKDKSHNKHDVQNIEYEIRAFLNVLYSYKKKLIKMV